MLVGVGYCNRRTEKRTYLEVLEVLEDPLPALLLVGCAGAGAARRLRRHGGGSFLCRFAGSLCVGGEGAASQGRVKILSFGERERGDGLPCWEDAH